MNQNKSISLLIVAYSVFGIEISYFFPKYNTVAQAIIVISSSVKPIIICPIFIVINLVIMKWLFVELKSPEIFHNSRVKYYNLLKKNLISNGAQKSSNLNHDFGNFFNDKKDVYYINKNFIIKDSNIFNEGIQFYSGYYMPMNPFLRFYHEWGYIFNFSIFQRLFLLILLLFGIIHSLYMIIS